MGRRGFTLIELSVVISLIGLICLVTFSTLTGFKERLYLEAAAAQLASEMRKTQVEAICASETRSVTVEGRQFIFSKSGNPPPGGSGTAIISNRFGRRSLIVSSAGRVRVE